jgi:hypothetical protein
MWLLFVQSWGGGVGIDSEKHRANMVPGVTVEKCSVERDKMPN